MSLEGVRAAVPLVKKHWAAVLGDEFGGDGDLLV